MGFHVDPYTQRLVTDWERWFAWRPVRTPRGIVWLRVIQRRFERVYDSENNRSILISKYREIV